MEILTAMLIHKAVYWPPAGRPDDFGGQGSSDPVDIDCRWEPGSQERIYVDTTEVTADDKVYVDRVVAVGGWLLRNKTRAQLAKLNPPPPAAKQIKVYKELDTLQGDDTCRWAYT